MADRVDAKVLEILCRQTRQHIAIDIIFAEDRFVLLEPEPVEPCRNVHVRLPAGANNPPRLPYRDRRLRARYQRGRLWSKVSQTGPSTPPSRSGWLGSFMPE